MLASHLMATLAGHGRDPYLIGDLSAGVIAALGLEGRLFAVLDGRVLNRFDPGSLDRMTTAWRNPGGDVLWPAPEGTRLGYHYADGAWRVPSTLVGARWQADPAGPGRAVLSADLELVNAQGLSIPVQAQRTVAVAAGEDGLAIAADESLVYRGSRPLPRTQALLAPWSLSQFTCGPGCEAVFPDAGPGCVWDLYAPSDHLRRLEAGHWRVRTDGDARFQIALGDRVPWIEFRRPDGLRVRRSALPPAAGRSSIDIADRPPHCHPDERGCFYSIYADAGGFMELEAAGAMPAELLPGTRLELSVVTRISCRPSDA